MSFLQNIDEFLVGRIAFPAVNYLMNRDGISGRYRSLLVSEREPNEAIEKMQFQKLAAVVRQAHARCPFYARLFRKIGLVPEDIRSLQDFKRIPPLDRTSLIDDRLDLVDDRCREAALAADRSGRAPGSPLSFGRFRRHRLVRNTSTGSTGTPTVFYEDGSTTALSWIHEQRLKSWYGIAPGAKEARMKGISTQFESKSALRSARERLWNQLMLPGFFLSDIEYQFCLEEIRKFKPRVLWGPTPGLAGLARHIQRTDQDISRYRPQLIISWAAPLYVHEKKLLADVFGCPVSNIYGTREVGHVAMMCPQGSFHVNQENYLVEIEGGTSGRSAPLGQILVTPLNETPMPLLRYRLGDLAELGGTDCSCGRSLLTLKRILGRTGDVFRTEDGRLIEPNFWCLAFMSGRPSQNVEQFQVIYRRSDSILFRIVPRLGYSLETEAELRRFLEETFPSRMHFEFEYVSRIAPQASGKSPIVVNEIQQREQAALPARELLV